MIRKHVKERREKLRHIAAKDAAARCPTCRSARQKPEYWAPYCSLDCAHEHLERIKALEARR